jgi:hypothetical protein
MVPKILANEKAKRVGYRHGNLLTKLTKVARLMSDNVKDCSGYEFMPFLYVIEL